MAMGNNDGDMMSEINVTPLVDVMLVLLVVFIITAPLLAPQAIKIKLPQTESLPQKDKPDSSSLVIDSKGSVSMDTNPVDESTLAQVLAIKSSNPEFQLQIQADQNVNYGRVAQVMAIAQKAGVSKLSFMTLTK